MTEEPSEQYGDNIQVEQYVQECINQSHEIIFKEDLDFLTKAWQEALKTNDSYDARKYLESYSALHQLGDMEFVFDFRYSYPSVIIYTDGESRGNSGKAATGRGIS